MHMGGQAPRVMAIMWALTAVSWVMIFLRNYTRIWIVRHVGADDHVYTLTGASYPPLSSPWKRVLTAGPL